MFAPEYQIDEGELYLDVEEYEDYSDSYWDRDWITDYYDNQEIGDKIEFMIQFARDCVDDQKYREANDIYEWLWEMSVSTDPEYECESVDLEQRIWQRNMVWQAGRFFASEKKGILPGA